MKKLLQVTSVLTFSIILTLSLSLESISALPSVIDSKPLPSLAPILTDVLPTVVSIKVEGVHTQKSKLPPEFQFFFGPHFPMDQDNKRPFFGQGSGVIIQAKKGFVVTNYHVINKADKIRVKLHDGREYNAKLIGYDELSDLALIQLFNAKDLKEIKIANSDRLHVGDFAIAIGDPFGLGHTATSGIISALSRSGLNIDGLENFIQTDASINQGNSGGALVNLSGELIGINTAILAPNGVNIGIGFAIPSNIVNSLSQQIIKYGEIRRGTLGIRGNNMDASIADALKIPIQHGVFVNEVLPHSAAARAGVKAGDVITSFEGATIHNFAELRAKVASAGQKKITLGILRDEKNLILNLELSHDQLSSIAAESLTPVLQGASLSDIEYRGQKRVKVDEVKKNSPAERIGLHKNDYIVGINNQSVSTVNQLQQLFKDKENILLLNILRGREELYLILK